MPSSTDATDHTKPTTWLVDSSIYVFRAWYTWTKGIEDTHGNPIHAVHGFLHFIYQLLHTEQPQRIAFVFDEPLKRSHRRELYPDYKAHRKSAPEDLRYQFEICRQFLQALGIAECSSPYFEADDLIGTFAKHYRQQGHRIFFITGDKDLTQLLYEHDLWWEYGNNQKLDTWSVHKRFGVYPRQIADVLAIAGDKSDNIPGVPEIGMSTAAKLLKKFGNVENLISRSPEIGQGKLRRARYIQRLVEDNIDTIRVSKQLTQIVCDAHDTPLDMQLCRKQRQADREKLWELFDLLKLGDKERKDWLRMAGMYETAEIPFTDN